MTQELQNTENNTAMTELPMSLEDMAADSGKGGKLGIQDIGVPFLYILQTNSPQVNPDNPKYMKGATAGGIYITVIERAFEGREKGLVCRFHSWFHCSQVRSLAKPVWIQKYRGTNAGQAA